jgi:hypothetical protein
LEYFSKQFILKRLKAVHGSIWSRLGVRHKLLRPSVKYFSDYRKFCLTFLKHRFISSDGDHGSRTEDVKIQIGHAEPSEIPRI